MSKNNDVTLNIELTGVDENIEKAIKLVELLKEAKSLAEDLALIDFKINVSDECQDSN